VIGVVKAPDLVTAALQQAFLKSGFQTEPLSNDPAAFGIYKGTLTSIDSALLSKCTT
jgi:hypothetical protein